MSKSLFRPFTIRLLAGALLSAVLSVSEPANAQVCGDADGSGSLAGADITYLGRYLWAQGSVPTGLGNVDDYELNTVRDVVFIAWNLVTSSPALSCPPAQPPYVPALDPASLLVYDETFPAYATYQETRLFLKNTDSVAGMTLPLRITVGGLSAAVVSVTLTSETNVFDIREASFSGSTVLFGLATFTPARALGPGTRWIGTVGISLEPSPSDRVIEMDWFDQPPLENSTAINYPMLLESDLSAVRPDLLASCVADTDGDGVVDCLDLCPGFADSVDTDGDSVPDGCDICPGYDDRIDADGDAVPDGCDLCAGFDDRLDTDADGVPDCLDACTDSDGDGFGNPGFAANSCPDDNCPYLFNPFQIDSDADQVGNGCDNCPNTGNLSQLESDGDGVGDACDNCPYQFNPTQGDVDGDGTGNVCDPDAPQLQVLANLQVSGWGAGCWGYTAPDGNEYAFFGGAASVVVVQTWPAIGYVTELPHVVSGWREIKSYRNVLYAVSEGSGQNAGLLVADLTPLPATVSFIGLFPVDGASAVTSHNLTVDTVRGYAYLEGDRGSRSIHIHNLANPAAPAYVGSFGNFSQGIHDLYAHNNLLYVAEGSTSAWSIWNVTNKANPVMRVRVSSPSAGYMHNIWPTADGHYCVTTEETTNRTVKVWDISDYANVRLIGEYLAPSRLAHNALVFGNVVFISHYESGIVALSLADPENPLEAAVYDTYPWGEGPNFWGCWGVYPYSQHGLVCGSNMDGTLTVLRFTGSTGCAVSRTGDIDHSGVVSSADLVALVGFVFQGMSAPVPCQAAGDVNCSGSVTSSDIIALVNFVFKSGAAPCDVCTLIPGTWSCP